MGTEDRARRVVADGAWLEREHSNLAVSPLFLEPGMETALYRDDSGVLAFSLIFIGEVSD